MSRLGFGDARIFDDPQVQQRVKEIAQLGGEVASVTGASVDNTDPANPIVNAVASVVAGTNVTVDDTDPANPVVNAAGGTPISIANGGGSIAIDGAGAIVATPGGGQGMNVMGTLSTTAVTGDGSGLTNLPSGGLAHSTVGNTAQVMAGFLPFGNGGILRQITFAVPTLVLSVAAFIKQNVAQNTELDACIWSDNAGSPGVIVGGGSIANFTTLDNTVGHWVQVGVGAWLPAGTYWFGMTTIDRAAFGSTSYLIAGDAGVSDGGVYGAIDANNAGAGAIDWAPNGTSFGMARSYSLYANVLS